MPLHEPGMFRILVVDDEAPILAEYNEILASGSDANAGAATLAKFDEDLFGNAKSVVSHLNFSVCLCRQADEAIAAVEESVNQEDPFAVAFVDVRMPPGRDGIEASEAIRAVDPDINIVIVTGYSDVPLSDIVARVPPVDKLLYFRKPLQASELRQLAFALTRKWHTENVLRQKVVLQSEKLQAATENLERIVEKLQVAKNATETANRAKLDFLAKMNYVLRTPLNAIIDYTELLQEEVVDRDDEGLIAELTKVRNDGKHLLGLINNLLDLSKVEAGKMELDLQETNLDALLAEIDDTVRPLVAEKGNVFEVSGTASVAVFITDAQKLRQALLNLLGNAAKFTSNGAIRLEVTQEPAGWLNFIVSDTGVGMEPDQLTKVLEPFTQADATVSETFGGTGLGLAITRGFAELLGGWLDVDSEPGRGSRFTISLPIQQIDDAGANAASA